MTKYWNKHLPTGFSQRNAPLPLHQPKILGRDDAANDFEDINWKALLAGGNNPPTLRFDRSEEDFLRRAQDDITLERFWDIDSFFFGISSLGFHRHAFHLALRPPFLRRITQNPRITLHGLQIHKTMQLRLGYGAGDHGFGASTHIFFPHLPVGASDTFHLSDQHQRC